MSLRQIHRAIEPLESRTLLTAGQLDPTFGTGGYAHYDFPQAQQVGANVVLIDSEGRVVAAGGGTNSNAIALPAQCDDGQHLRQWRPCNARGDESD